MHLYSLEQTRVIEKRAFEFIDDFELMKRAGAAAFKVLQKHFGDYKAITVLCGAGNNGGDGLILAGFAKRAGYTVMCLATGQYHEKAQAWSGVDVLPYHPDLILRDSVIVSALIGIGLKDEVKEPVTSIIEHINQLDHPVLAIDVPSGLNVDTGMGNAVKADVTITFITLKQGLYLGGAKDYCGIIEYDDLGVPKECFENVAPQYALLERRDFPARVCTGHKGMFGHVLLIGGDYGMPGAIIMAAQAALRMGAGKVSVATRPEHFSMLITRQPEIMCRDINHFDLSDITCVVVGPGLGNMKENCQWVISDPIPKVIDADALDPAFLENLSGEVILTPHLGEGYRLTGQKDRRTIVETLSKQYNATVVLKGCGTIVKAPNAMPYICPFGNSKMATAGAGDILAGVIGGLMAQNIKDPAHMGVVLHAHAGDMLAKYYRRIIATDLLDYMRSIY